MRRLYFIRDQKIKPSRGTKWLLSLSFLFGFDVETLLRLSECRPMMGTESFVANPLNRLWGDNDGYLQKKVIN